MSGRLAAVALFAVVAGPLSPIRGTASEQSQRVPLDLLFERREEVDDVGALMVRAGDLVVMPNGDLLAVNVFGETFTRFDRHGSVLWERSLSGGKPRDTAALPGGGFVSVGTKHVSPIRAFPPGIAIKGNIDLWVARFDDDGSLLWEKAFGDLGLEIGKSVAVLEDGNLALLGAVEEQAWLMTLIPEGRMRGERRLGGENSAMTGLPDNETAIISQVQEYPAGGCGAAFDSTPIKIWRFDKFGRLRGVVTARDGIVGSASGCGWNLELLADPTSPESAFVSSVLDSGRAPVPLEVAKVHLEQGPVWSRPVLVQDQGRPCWPALAVAANGDLVGACSRRGVIDIDVFAGADGQTAHYRASSPDCDRAPELAAQLTPRIELAALSNGKLALAGATFTKSDICSWLTVFSVP